MARRYRDAVEALNALLDMKERDPGRLRAIVYPDYDRMTSEAEREAFHRVIDNAEVAQAVEVKRDRRAGPADIRFVALNDPVRLTRLLRRTPAGDAAQQAIAALRAEVGPLPDWIASVLEEIAAAWAVRRQPYPGLVPGDVHKATKFLRILCAIDRQDHQHGWDMRTFSRRACGDSKAVETGMIRLTQVLRGHFGLPKIAPREVLAALGIEKFPQPVLIRGQLSLAAGYDIDARPYIGLPPEWTGKFTITVPVPYVLLVENLASFNRHAREVADDGIIVYSGGFPSKSTLATIQHLDAILPGPVPLFHWGDSDRHGFLIFDYIKASIRRPLRPHLMEREAATSMEQEQMDPRSPVAGAMLYYPTAPAATWTLGDG